ncbi:hypothetical protein CULT_180048 [[Clostridium] ultunense Esp]|nr:hypothetical protein CULT_180048 [[Clostridium] ultunense Esp]
MKDVYIAGNVPNARKERFAFLFQPMTVPGNSISTGGTFLLFYVKFVLIADKNLEQREAKKNVRCVANGRWILVFLPFDLGL